MALVSTLLEVLEKSAKELGVQLLPNSDKPLDMLHGIDSHERVGDSLDLEISLAQFLEVKPVTHLFGVELVRAIRVNTRWLIAGRKDDSEEHSRPRGSFMGVQPVHAAWSTQPLPPDSDIPLSRGELFEAQRDGKYGSAVNCPIDKAAAEIQQLAAAGTDIKSVEISSQPYAIVKGIEAKSPPWDHTTYDIAIVIPISI